MSYSIYTPCPSLNCNGELEATHFHRSMYNEIRYIMSCHKCGFKTKELTQNEFNAIKDNNNAEERDNTLLSFKVP